MADFEKAYWITDGDNISVRMPIAKIDKSKRIVSGWATTDSVDKQGDIVNADASAKAFEKFRGNVREQHTPLAVGKVVSFKQDKYFDNQSNEFYNGIYVDVYVSKGAEDTWHKINEGILTGFSIGGSIKESENVYNKAMDQEIRVIKEYDLYELSLVDNPANPNSNIVSVQKLVDGNVEIEKNFLENVYWCGSSDTVILSEKSAYACPQCDKNMINIGFVESNDVNKTMTVKELIDEFTKSSDNKSDNTQAIDAQAKSIAEKIEKEGNTVGILNRKTTTTVVEETIAKSEEPEAVEEAVEETEEVEEAAEEAVEEVAEEIEKSADPEEAAEEETVEEAVEEAAEEAVEKSTTPTEESNTDDLAKAVSEIKDSVADSLGDLAAVVKGLAEQMEALKKSLDGVTEEVNTMKGDVTKFGERVEVVEADTAVRKSGDLGGIVQEENTEKSMWGGRFLKSADLYR